MKKHFYKEGTKKDWIQKRRGWYLRLSPHLYPTEEDIKRYRFLVTKKAIADYYKHVLINDKFPELSW